ncbi:sugar ABC transporter ATP-binding protein [Jatrophihabitans cynanchi]|uniref:Sugar ABC transporter ATP-binding protein n=1 Tax=Jatrophihabitans cynanchi TaxID=2944128 RepID=A0ABY7K6Y2_9ACTN|nr:sugar ABC transporter ATP-binding protein [Jatrophihabitans sp. SB3-54]WAX59026.1 sugar ABC transporter ATP-binding protein [Jatrophihabitans sp. SB3-54]
MVLVKRLTQTFDQTVLRDRTTVSVEVAPAHSSTSAAQSGMPTRAWSDAVLAVREVTKRYGGVVAVDAVTFELRRGEILALAGENGAGKSTIIGIMAGARRPDAGEICVEGELVQFARPSDARARGIGVVYQEAALVPHLTVVDNVFLGREPRSRWSHRINRRAIRREYAELCRQTGIELVGTRTAATLSVAERQLVQILRVVAIDARIIILDEPTAALSPEDRSRMFDLLQRLRVERGASFILVSHFLDELEQHCDRAVVLRNGRVAGEIAERPVGARVLARMMARDRILESGDVELPPAADAEPTIDRGTGQPVVLKITGLRALGAPPVDLQLHRGEVVGLAGLVGSGRTELLRAVALARGRTGGDVHLNGVAIHTPRHAVRNGLLLLPEDRRSGLLMDWSLWRNVSLASLRRTSAGGFLRPRAERRRAVEFLDRLSVKAASPDAKVSTLSGGNQQKVAFARVLAAEAPVALLDEPTHGIDVHTKAEILAIIRGLAGQGKAFIVVAAEFGDLLAVCSRILTLHKGAVINEHDLALGSPTVDDLLFEAATGRVSSMEDR